jgi:hypothetical protein
VLHILEQVVVVEQVAHEEVVQGQVEVVGHLLDEQHEK